MKLFKGDLMVETSLPREQVRLRAEGFVPESEYVAPTGGTSTVDSPKPKPPAHD